MLKDLFNYFWLVNETDDPYLALALGTGKGVGLINMEETLKSAQASGAQSEADKKPRDGRFAEMGVHDSVGQLVDVTVHGWKA